MSELSSRSLAAAKNRLTRKKDHNRAEAILIAHYGKCQTNLGEV